MGEGACGGPIGEGAWGGPTAGDVAWGGGMGERGCCGGPMGEAALPALGLGADMVLYGERNMLHWGTHTFLSPPYKLSLNYFYVLTTIIKTNLLGLKDAS